MVDYEDSSQLHLWLFQSTSELQSCRARANCEARTFLAEQASSPTTEGDAVPSSNNSPKASSSSGGPLPVSSFACGYRQRIANGTEQLKDYDSIGPPKNGKDHPFLTPHEEQALVAFYGSKLPLLIGPLAQVPRLKRESKVTATAALLYRRFYLSNSVMLYDPKCIMVAAAFLASKVEDATADVRYLEEGTALMNAPVVASDIIAAEIALIAGVNFDLLCFHPFKAVLSLVEDLRTFLKSEKGQALVHDHDKESGASEGDHPTTHRPIVGQDLKPMYDGARRILQDAVVSDVPLLYSPGQVGLAALMVAQDEALQQAAAQEKKDDEDTTTPAPPPRIDLMGYVRQRFDGSSSSSSHLLQETLPQLCGMLRSVTKTAQKVNDKETLVQLKGIHKKLKKVRAWGNDKKEGGGKKKKKKSSAEATEGGPDAKRQRKS